MILPHLRERTTLDSLASAIARVELPHSVRLMEVCGGHTAVIHRYALSDLLPSGIELLSGPGCPVCVTDDTFVDECVALAQDPNVILATFGDLVRVPGSETSLAEARARGADVRIFYSPMAALQWAQAEPNRTVVLAGIGFETTACALAAVMHEAVKAEVHNLRLLSAMKTMPGALRTLVQDEDVHIDGLILPGHVMTVTGTDPFEFLSHEFRIPCAVSGFEPADMLSSILSIIMQIADSTPRVDIQYSRSVRPEGNRHAQELMDHMFEPCAAWWRGLGKIPDSGLRLRSHYAAWDAAALVRARPTVGRETSCLCGDVLRGRLRPAECPLFGRACTPETPHGACMVSSEGACAAAYQFSAVYG